MMESAGGPPEPAPYECPMVIMTAITLVNMA